MERRHTVSTLIAMVVMSASAAPALAEQPPAPACGQPIATDVALIEDLDCDLVIVGSELTVDLAGFSAGVVSIGQYCGLHDPCRARDVTLRGEGKIAGLDIYHGGLGTVVEELTIEARDGRDGWAVNVDPSTGGILMRDLKIRGHVGAFDTGGYHLLDSRVIGDVYSAEWGLVRGNRITGKVFVNGYGGGGVIVDNVIAGTVGMTIGAGPFLLGEIRDNRITVPDPNDIGISVWAEFDEASGVTITGNRITGGHTGIEVGYRWTTDFDFGDYVDVVIANNQVQRTSDVGISIRPGLRASNSRVIDNLVQHSGGDGIRVRGSQAYAVGWTVGGNTVIRSGGHGIDAPGTSPGMRNNVLVTGLTPACIGALCR